MSGGSHNYAYRHVDEFIEAMECSTAEEDVTRQRLRRKFIKHLHLVSTAMQAIEWVDSGDCSPPHDENAIRTVFR